MKIEVSNGEIVDKLTILEIKLRNSDCDQKSKQIVKEMTYLSPIVEELNIPDELIDNLRVVNQKLWDVEDALRVHEYNKDFVMSLSNWQDPCIILMMHDFTINL